MAKHTAGILVYRKKENNLEVLLVHPGGPFWAKKDLGAWSIPKGQPDDGEDDFFEVAKREFKEETSFDIDGDFKELAPIKTSSGRIIHIWAVPGDLDASQIKSNTISIDWPPRSGKKLEIPEVDRGEWFTLEVAKQKIVPVQVGFLEEIEGFK